MDPNEHQIIEVNADNINSEHICCAIGNDKVNQQRANMKKAWMKAQFEHGYVFKKFDVRGKVFIEYVPADKAWAPINASGYSYIQCFWVAGKYNGEGFGSKLFQSCEDDTIHTNGLVAISSPKKLPFLSDKKFFLRKGFEVCDTLENGFELLVKKFNKNAPDPKFTDIAKAGMQEDKKGITIYYTEMCPFVPDFVNVMIETAKKKNVLAKKIKIESLEQSKASPMPFGISSVFYNGKFLTQEIMPEKKFAKLLDTLV